MKKRLLQFSALALLLAIACAVPVKIADAATGTISASAKYVMIPSGLGSTDITYSTSGCTTAQLYVNMDNTYDKLMCTAAANTCHAGWIQAGHSYTFRLYANTDRTELLGSVTVVGVASNSGTIAVRETEVIIPSGSTLGSAEITFAINGYSMAQMYVQVNDGAEALMCQNTANTCNAGWIQNGYKYTFKLYANTSHTTLLDSATLYGRKFAYEVGPNYLSTTSDFQDDHFITEYHTGSVRSTVQSQLQAMANAGASRIKTSVLVYGKQFPEAGYPVPDPQLFEPTDFWCHFPPSTQELANIRQFAQDVAAVIASDGHRLLLDIEMHWYMASDYMTGDTVSSMGVYNLSPTDVRNRMVSTYQGIINNVYNVYRSDYKKVIGSISVDNETSMGKNNMEWFLDVVYPGFVTYCLNRGVTPALELLPDLSNPYYIMSTTITDPNYSILNGHRAMYWPYRTLKYMKDNGLYIPNQINFSLYPQKGTTSYTFAQLLTKIFDDADAVLPSLGVRKYYGVTEAEYFHPTTTAGNLLREELGAAFAQERLRHNRVVLLQFWTTPAPIDDWEEGTYVYPAPAPPFQIDDYLP